MSNRYISSCQRNELDTLSFQPGPSTSPSHLVLLGRGGRGRVTVSTEGEGRARLRGVGLPCLGWGGAMVGSPCPK